MKWRHVRHALASTTWAIAGLAVLLGSIAVTERRSFEDMLWAAGVALVVWLCAFGYALWRTQNDRPPPQPPSD